MTVEKQAGPFSIDSRGCKERLSLRGAAAINQGFFLSRVVYSLTLTPLMEPASGQPEWRWTGLVSLDLVLAPHTVQGCCLDSRYCASRWAAGEPVDLCGSGGWWMLCWMCLGHNRSSPKPSEKGIKEQRKFPTDFSTHLVNYKAWNSEIGEQQKWELWEEIVQRVTLPGQEANADGEKEPSPGMGECIVALHGAAPAAGSSWWKGRELLVGESWRLSSFVSPGPNAALLGNERLQAVGDMPAQCAHVRATSECNLFAISRLKFFKFSFSQLIIYHPYDFSCCLFSIDVATSLIST